MATVGQNALFSGIVKQPASAGHGDGAEQTAGPVLFLGGAAFAAAYLVVGATQLSLLGAFLAIAGTALVFLGLRSIARKPL